MMSRVDVMRRMLRKYQIHIPPQVLNDMVQRELDNIRMKEENNDSTNAQ
jgi:hypothetical protein